MFLNKHLELFRTGVNSNDVYFSRNLSDFWYNLYDNYSFPIELNNIFLNFKFLLDKNTLSVNRII